MDGNVLVAMTNPYYEMRVKNVKIMRTFLAEIAPDVDVKDCASRYDALVRPFNLDDLTDTIQFKIVIHVLEKQLGSRAHLLSYERLYRAMIH